MMHLFVNGAAASAGGGLTYLRNVVPELSAQSRVKTTILTAPTLRREFGELPNISWAELETADGVGHRFWGEQTKLRQLIRNCGADMLLSAGNFALWRSPVPQILLSGNSLYTSADFYRDIRSRGEYRMLWDTCLKGLLAKRSTRWADRTVSPSRAFAQDLRQWTGSDVVTIYHGFNREAFCADATPLPDEIQGRVDEAKDALRLLFVSHYNYYRNFETLLRAIPLLRERLGSRRIVLFLTCNFHSNQSHGEYRTQAAAALVRKLDIAKNVVELGSIPYGSLHHLYRTCDIYVTPAYAETFAHPLVEAQACGLPVVASDLPVHREICRDSALYFPRFSPEGLADAVMMLRELSGLRERMVQLGLRRSRDFSWRTHVEEIISVADSLIHPA